MYTGLCDVDPRNRKVVSVMGATILAFIISFTRWISSSIQKAYMFWLRSMVRASLFQFRSLPSNISPIFSANFTRVSFTATILRVSFVLDTIVAIFSGLIIVPACFSFGIEPNAGPALIFLTLPRVFKSMPLGNFWGTLFFLFMFFASFSTVLAVFENILSNFMDNFNWDRKKSVLIALVIILIGSIPCVLGYNMLSNFHPMPGKDILDTEDFIVSNLILPIGSLVFLLFCTSKYGWGFDKYLEECNAGTGVKMSKAFSFYFKFILPLIIIFILVQGLR